MMMQDVSRVGGEGGMEGESIWRMFSLVTRLPRPGGHNAPPD